MIKVSNLEFGYTKKTQALKGISFEIKEGSWVSIIGHNGSGKSTLSKLLNGLLEPRKGEVYIDGKLLNEDTVSDIRKDVGIVFQNPDNQFVGVSVKHDMAFGLENRRVERDEMVRLIDEYAKKVDMEKFLDSEPHLLSGGQKQRVAIAGVLAMNPKVIIFDEATSMLDPEGTKDIIELIEKLKGSRTIITITHDLDLAYKSDRIIVLKEGNIIADDIPSEIFKKPDMLIDAKLDIPFKLKLYNAAKKDPEISKNKELIDVLWQFCLKK